MIEGKIVNSEVSPSFLLALPRCINGFLSASLYPGVQMGSGDCNSKGKPRDLLASHAGAKPPPKSCIRGARCVMGKNQHGG